MAMGNLYGRPWVSFIGCYLAVCHDECFRYMEVCRCERSMVSRQNALRKGACMYPFWIAKCSHHRFLSLLHLRVTSDSFIVKKHGINDVVAQHLNIDWEILDEGGKISTSAGRSQGKDAQAEQRRVSQDRPILCTAQLGKLGLRFFFRSWDKALCKSMTSPRMTPPCLCQAGRQLLRSSLVFCATTTSIASTLKP